MKKLREQLYALLVEGLSLIGFLFYLVESYEYAHTQSSLLDEGAYLFKGYLFVTGQYVPYQDYGPWTNHMPLAFLIPGVVQGVFSPGLRTGRMLAVLWGALTLIGLWILVRRLGGKGWATLSVWSVALNPTLVKLYSLAKSQSLVVCMLVWTLVLVLGKERTIGHLLAGAFLAGILWMTRINMAPVLLLLVGYIFWQYGWKAGWLSGLVGGLPILIGHALYFPNILRVWAHWLPADLFSFLKPFAHPPGSDPSWNPIVTPQMRLMSFWQGIRFHFFNLMAVLGGCLFWQPKRRWQNPEAYRTLVFLLSLFVVLFLSHVWAALGNDYCVYCFGVYLSFFSWMGLLILVVSFSQGLRQGSIWHDALVVGLVLALSMGIWASAHSEGFGRQAFQDATNAVLNFLEVRVPRLRSWHIEAGNVELKALLQNKWGLTDELFKRSVQNALVLFTGCLFAVVVFMVSRVILTRIKQTTLATRLTPGWSCFVGFLSVGFILSPTMLLGGGFHTYDCGGDVLRGYEIAGRRLADVISPGSWVYWRGGDSAVPLLYLSEVKIFPAQINGDYSYHLGGDADALERYGFWSEELAHRWAERADFILIEEQQFRGWLAEFVERSEFDELTPTPPTEPCRPGSAIHIFRRER